MSRRLALILLELVAGLLLVLMAAGGVLAWRLSQGPLRVQFLTPYVEQALNREIPARIAISGTELSWAGFGRPVEVRAIGVTGFGENGTQVAALRGMRIGFSLPAILSGRAAPVYLELEEPVLNAVRDGDGALRLDIMPSGSPVPKASATEEGGDAFLAALLDALRRPPDPLDPLGALRELRISRARLSVETKGFGMAWTAPRADILLTRDEGGMRGRAELDVDLGGRLTRIAADLSYRLADRALRTEARFNDLKPAELVQIAPSLAPLSGVDIELSGTLGFTLGADWRLANGRLAVTGNKGRVAVGDLLPAPVPLESLDFLATVEGELDRIVLERLRLDVGGPVLSITGDAARDGDDYRLILDTIVEQVRIADLRRLWPNDVMPKPRHWIMENLSEGWFDKVAFRLEGTAPAADPGALVPSRMRGNLSFSGATVTYFGELPAARDVAGTATFDGATLAVALTGGQMLDLRFGPSQLAITGLDTEDHRIALDIPLKGPLRSALEVIDHAPLGYASKINLKPATVAGDADIKLHFAFPLVADLKMERVTMRVEAAAKDVSIPDVVAEIDATEGDVELVVEPKKLVLVGTARLNGMPSRIDWEENFPEEAPVRTEVRIRASADDGDRERFSLSFPEWIGGPVGIDMLYTREASGRQVIDAGLDLTPATLRIDLLNWRKEPGLAGQGTVTVEFVDGRPVMVPRFSVRTAELETAGRMEMWWEDYRLKRLDLDKLRLGETEGAMIMHVARDGTRAVSVHGPSLDARQLLGDQGADKPVEPVPTPEEKAAEPPLSIAFDLGRVVTGGEGQHATAVTGEVGWQKGVLERIQIDARVGPIGMLKVDYGPEGDLLRLDLYSDDAGAALRELDLVPYVRGGKLVATGRSDPNDPKRTVSGQIVLTDYQVVDAPGLARLLSAASPQGFADFLSGQPISFSRAEGDYHWHPDGISFRSVRTSGSAVGLTLEGDVNVTENRLALQGTIVPFTLVNRLLSAIPLLGDMLVGGEGQGVFAATYSVTGKLGEPDIAVNPLAVLAPGFLRNLFFLGEPEGATGRPEALPTPKPAADRSGEKKSG